jgi:signal transduction histidine kinase
MNELSLHILDICQNSIKANATLIEIDVIDNAAANTYTIIIKDNGKGMDGKTLSQVSDPFYTTRTTRKVGLGISLFKMACEQAEGTFEITSKVNSGTVIKAVFQNNHIDRAPLGDIEETLVILLLNEANIDIYINMFVTQKHMFLIQEK